MALLSTLIKIRKTDADFPILLLDEPTTGLQPNLAHTILQFVVDLATSTRIAILVAEQDCRALDIANQVWHINGGRFLGEHAS